MRVIPYTELQSKAHPHRHPEMWRVPTVMPAWSQIKQSRSIGACRVPGTVLGTGVWHITSLNSAISTGIMQRELSLCREGHITPNEATNPNPLVQYLAINVHSVNLHDGGGGVVGGYGSSY